MFKRREVNSLFIRAFTLVSVLLIFSCADVIHSIGHAKTDIILAASARVNDNFETFENKILTSEITLDQLNQTPIILTAPAISNLVLLTQNTAKQCELVYILHDQATDHTITAHVFLNKIDDTIRRTFEDQPGYKEENLLAAAGLDLPASVCNVKCEWNKKGSECILKSPNLSIVVQGFLVVGGDDEKHTFVFATATGIHY